MELLIKGNTSLNSLDGIGSKRQVDDLDEVTSEVSSARSIGEKHSK